MDLTIRGKASCTNCNENFDGKLVVHLQEDSEGQLTMVPPLETNELAEVYRHDACSRLHYIES